LTSWRNFFHTRCLDESRFWDRQRELQSGGVLSWLREFHLQNESPGKKKESIAMKTEIRNSISGLLLIPLVLACFALLPRVQAAPDPAPPPGNNTRDGAGAMANVTTGLGNTAFGTNALFSLTTGDNNAAQGNSALFSNVDGNGNTAVGSIALRFLTLGDQNVAIGNTALNNVTTGSRNTAVGYGTLRSGNFSDNTAVGWSALISNTTGARNVATGMNALASNTDGNSNTANGANALVNNTHGLQNTANGASALLSNETGDGNTAYGANALHNNTTGEGNTALGFGAGTGVMTADNVIAIGIPGANVNNSCYIGNIFGATVAAATDTPVIIDSSGKLGTTTSSQRFKKDIKPMDQASEAILSLKPVTFHYKTDNTSTARFGLIAEEVAQLNPDLVVRDDKGEIYSVRYDAVNAMLLNEFLKAHSTVQELKSTVAKQEATAAAQQKQIEALTAGLQKVSAELELSKPAKQVVGNNQ
jgi:trimeric autotransporter adhesin